MNKALIIAGGRGNRMGLDIPKQFIEVFGKPILIYTLEAFDEHPLIDEIVVVCVAGWENLLVKYISKFGIKKKIEIIAGGGTGQESIRNGVFHLERNSLSTDIIIIHDGIRPLVDKEVLSDVILTALKYGNGVTSLPYNEQIFVTNDGQTTTQYIPRDTLRRVQTPQAYTMSKLSWAYKKAFEENIGIGNSSYTNTMMVELGETLYFASGSDRNIKLTTQDDLLIFKSMLRMEKI